MAVQLTPRVSTLQAEEAAAAAEAAAAEEKRKEKRKKKVRELGMVSARNPADNRP